VLPAHSHDADLDVGGIHRPHTMLKRDVSHNPSCMYCMLYQLHIEEMELLTSLCAPLRPPSSPPPPRLSPRLPPHASFQALSLQSIVKSGKARSWGVSNWGVRELEQLYQATGTRPMVNQIEYHPWCVRVLPPFHRG